jgi:hypothetical protein
MQMGMIDSPEKYDSVMVYGSVKPIQEKRMTKESLVSYENQELRNGNLVRALATDDHAYHISYHAMEYNDPEVRRRPELIARIDEHIQEHLELSRLVDVGLYAMVQTGKNIPPDQNTPTGMPEMGMGMGGEVPMEGGSIQANPEGAPVETVGSGPGENVAQPAQPAQPLVNIGDMPNAPG